MICLCRLKAGTSQGFVKIRIRIKYNKKKDVFNNNVRKKDL